MVQTLQQLLNIVMRLWCSLMLLLLLLEQQMLMQCMLLGWREMWMRMRLCWHMVMRGHVWGQDVVLWRRHQMMWWRGRGWQHCQAGGRRRLGWRAGSVAVIWLWWAAGLLLLMMVCIAGGDNNSRRIVADNRVDAEANLLLGCGQHDG